MDSTVLPRWDVMCRDYIETGLPHRLVVRTYPGLQIFTDAGAARLGARFELEHDAPPTLPSILEQIIAADVTVEGRRWLEISATTPSLYESFYRLVSQVTDAVFAEVAPQIALAQAVQLWETLIQHTSILSEERQAGLFGELLFLERLHSSGVFDAVASWVGPDRQAHDFRCGNVEFEVKTTSGAKRLHTINGLGQLSPSLHCSLYLVSMQMTDAGDGGRSLPELIDSLLALLPPVDLGNFKKRLEVSGWLDRHRTHYTRRRKLRGAITLVPIIDGVPRLTAAALSTLPHVFAAQRIDRVVYDINVTGLGFEDGTPEFLAVVPPVQG